MEATEKQHPPMTNVPLGMSLLQGCLFSSPWSRKKKLFLRATVFILTFLCYMSYHLSRKPPSIVKSVLHNTDKETNDDDDHSSSTSSASASALLTSDGGWAPFDNEHKGEGMLGSLDTAFLASYAVGMFFSGHLGDRVNLRYFLSAGMILTGICTTLFGMAYLWNIHSFWYFVVVQVLSGLFQSTGWPSVVSIMGNWFGKGRRGFVMGVWNANTSVGNILGALVASAALGLGWGYSFILPGIIIGGLGVIVFFFLVVAPPPSASASNDEAKAAEEGSINQDEKFEGGDENEEEIYLLENSKHQAGREEKKKEKGINFFKAWLIPGVAEFALALFFCKLVSYTFLYWLPFYLKHTEQKSEANVLVPPKQATSPLSSTWAASSVASLPASSPTLSVESLKPPHPR
ncbi:glucose-6-phosphate exchanger SLC37A2-like isoform X7, variant 2 [Balamuthia mandrillaris]